jgi:hypothetical protein
MRSAFPLLLTLALAVFTARLAAQEKATPRTGTVVGTIVFDGTPPAPRTIKGHDDKEHSDESLVVATGGGISNVVAVIDSVGLSPWKAPSPTITFTSERITPRVVFVSPGVEVVIKNDTDQSENVKGNAVQSPFNQSIARRGSIRKTFEKPERITLSCSCCPWQAGVVIVTESPLHALSSAEGRIEIANVPVGKWTLILWHEVLGKKKLEVEVTADKTTDMGKVAMKK